MKNEEFEKLNENKFLNFQTEIKSFNNIDLDNDKETDDILTKLGNLSPTSNDKSFDSPIIFNRCKTFYNRYNTESKNFLNETFNMNNKTCRNFLDKTNYELKNKTNNEIKQLKREFRPRSLISIKSQSNFRNFKLSNFHNELRKNRNCEDIPEIIRNNSNSHFNIHYQRLERINEKKVDNKINSNEIHNIKKKIENINNLIIEIKFIDKNLKRKDIKNLLHNYLLKNNENYLNKNSYESLNNFLDYIIEILSSIKNNAQKSNNKVGNEKIILKLQNELLEKEKEIGKFMNQMKLERLNLEKDNKSNNIEILNLRKENKDLNNKLLNSEKHISKLENNNKILEDKLNKLIIEKTSKTINSCSSVRSTFILNNFPKLESTSLDTTFISQNCQPNEQGKSNNNIKINDKYNASKKLNKKLIDLLKEVNTIIIHYDTNLNKEFGAKKNLQNSAKNLNSFMDINGLSEDKNLNMFINEYMRNIDIVFKKIEEYLKDGNKSNYSSRHASFALFKAIPKQEKNVSKNKDKINNNKSRNNNVANMTKKINATNGSIPTRKRTRTIHNTKIKDSI